VAFADPLYDILHTMFGWAGFHTKAFYDDNPDYKAIVLPMLNKTPRNLLIDFGTHIVRQRYHDQTWANCLFQNNDYADALIITDVRFLNEVKAIQERNGILIQVTRNVPVFEDAADSALATFTDWDYILENNGDLLELEKNTSALLEEILNDNS
jgi:hypothetical protein